MYNHENLPKKRFKKLRPEIDDLYETPGVTQKCGFI